MTAKITYRFYVESFSIYFDFYLCNWFLNHMSMQTIICSQWNPMNDITLLNTTFNSTGLDLGHGDQAIASKTVYSVIQTLSPSRPPKGKWHKFWEIWWFPIKYNLGNISVFDHIFLFWCGNCFDKSEERRAKIMRLNLQTTTIYNDEKKLWIEDT